MDQEQDARFKQAVERKKDAAREASHAHHPASRPQGEDPSNIRGDEESLHSDSRISQDTFDPRDKNSGHGKKTADKWNQ
jgi:hypothetical protein